MDIDTQFDIAVSIVQALPKSGKVQPDYEEKLQMYSLYKQATVGNVSSPRPAIWDVLGKAKWEAWAKQKDTPSSEAKRSYINSLRKVLRKYSDNQEAKKLLQRLGTQHSVNVSFNEPSTSAAATHESSDTDTDESESESFQQTTIPPVANAELSYPPHLHPSQRAELTSEEETSEEEGRHAPLPAAVKRRPQSAISSQQRYRTPVGLTGYSDYTSPPPHPPSAYISRGITQPLPTFSTPSAFATGDDDQIPLSKPTVASHTMFSDPSSVVYSQPQPLFASHGYSPHSAIAQNVIHHSPLQPHPQASQPHVHPQSLEVIIARIQGLLSALTERIERLEANQSHFTFRGIDTTASSDHNRTREDSSWDVSHLRLWSLVLTPVSRAGRITYQALSFLLSSEYDQPSSFRRSPDNQPHPALVAVRTIALDVSFFVWLSIILRLLWRRNKLKLRQIKLALRVALLSLIGISTAHDT